MRCVARQTAVAARNGCRTRSRKREDRSCRADVEAAQLTSVVIERFKQFLQPIIIVADRLDIIEQLGFLGDDLLGVRDRTAFLHCVRNGQVTARPPRYRVTGESDRATLCC